MNMKPLLVIVFVLLAGCSNPQKVVFGADPMNQLSDSALRGLAESDRQLLAVYIGAAGLSQAVDTMVASAGASAPQTLNPVITGRTVGQVLAEARAWQAQNQIAIRPAGK